MFHMQGALRYYFLKFLLKYNLFIMYLFQVYSFTYIKTYMCVFFFLHFLPLQVITIY